MTTVDGNMPGDARRTAILQAAGAVFLEQGFERATTLAIARRARMSKRALYACFASKEELFAALIRDSAGTMTLSADPPDVATPAAFHAALERFGHRFLARLLQPEVIGITRLAIAEASRAPELGRRLEEAGRAPVRAAVVALFTAAAGRGHIRADDIGLAVAAYLNCLVGPLQLQLLLGVLAAPSPEAVDERVRIAVEVVRRLEREEG